MEDRMRHKIRVRAASRVAAAPPNASSVPVVDGDGDGVAVAEGAAAARGAAEKGELRSPLMDRSVNIIATPAVAASSKRYNTRSRKSSRRDAGAAAVGLDAVEEDGAPDADGCVSQPPTPAAGRKRCRRNVERELAPSVDADTSAGAEDGDAARHDADGAAAAAKSSTAVDAAVGGHVDGAAADADMHCASAAAPAIIDAAVDGDASMREARVSSGSESGGGRGSGAAQPTSRLLNLKVLEKGRQQLKRQVQSGKQRVQQQPDRRAELQIDTCVRRARQLNSCASCILYALPCHNHEPSPRGVVATCCRLALPRCRR
jgi:hypothetical protein